MCACVCARQAMGYCKDTHTQTHTLVVVIEAEALAGTSDNIVIDKGEFRQVLNEAMRIARSFDDGLALFACSFHPYAVYQDVIYR